MELTKQKIQITRGMIRRTFLAKGLSYVSEVALKNVQDLARIIEWNEERGIKLFRMSSNMFPWMSEYNFEDLPDFIEICEALKNAGRLAHRVGQRLTFHPGQFCVLASPNEKVVANAVDELNKHALIMDLMGLSCTPYNKINIHVGGAYGDKVAALDRFCANFNRLNAGAKARLTVENDDRQSLFSVKDLYEGIHKRIGVPVVFDSHHWRLGPQDQSYQDALQLAVSTWPNDIVPMCHHSDSRRDFEDATASARSHSDWYYTPFNSFGIEVDVVLESKMKERALTNYRNKFQILAGV
jgi:UV DNA damage endonuclease